MRTTDGGMTWKAGVVPDASDLDFRDVHAASDGRAFLLSIGEGRKSRIYGTEDGGNTWALRFVNRDPRGFLDAMAFWDSSHGIVMGDPVDGRFTILTTDDGGTSWKNSPRQNMPPALESEGAFAASGTCLVVQGETPRLVWNGRSPSRPRLHVRRIVVNIGQSTRRRFRRAPLRPAFFPWCFPIKIKVWLSAAILSGSSTPVATSRVRPIRDATGRFPRVRAWAGIGLRSFLCLARPRPRWSPVGRPVRIFRPTAARAGSRSARWGFTPLAL